MSEPGLNHAAASARSARRRAAVMVALLALAALLPVALLASGERWPVARALLLARGSGWAACGLLLLSLAVTAVTRVGALLSKRSAGTAAGVRRASWPLPAPVLRRALGMGAAWVGSLHALAAFVGPLQRRLPALWQSAQLIAGASALCVLLLLLLTSWQAVIRTSRLRYFRELHRLSYAAALLVAQHVLLAPFASRQLALALLAAVGGLLALRFLPRARLE